MKKGLTEIVFILDRSGSMGGLEDDTIGGFNAMLEKQKAQSGEAFVSTVLFDHERVVIHDRVSLEKVPPLTREQYAVRGSTALLDAIGHSVHHIANVHKYAREEDVPENTVFIITTDGMENASHEFTSDAVKKLIERYQKDNGWTFLFLGANIDAVETAARYGISADQAAQYHGDSLGTRANYEAMSEAVDRVRACRPLDASWKSRVDQDYKSRKGE